MPPPVTFEIISRTPREIRIGRLEMGRPVKLRGEDYTVARVLKVGLNESLVYVRPVPTPALARVRCRPASTAFRQAASSGI